MYVINKQYIVIYFLFIYKYSSHFVIKLIRVINLYPIYQAESFFIYDLDQSNLVLYYKCCPVEESIYVLV